MKITFNGYMHNVVLKKTFRQSDIRRSCGSLMWFAFCQIGSSGVTVIIQPPTQKTASRICTITAARTNTRASKLTSQVRPQQRGPVLVLQSRRHRYDHSSEDQYSCFKVDVTGTITSARRNTCTLEPTSPVRVL